MSGYTKADVKMHSGLPAVNVKVYGSPRDAWAAFEREQLPDPRFTLDWIEEHVSGEDQSDVFWFVCESEFEYLERWATGADGDGLFPDDRVELDREGRSGGWVVVRGLPDVEEWDAVRLARWRRFERIAEEIAEGVPYQVLDSLYINQFEWWAEKQRDEASANAELPVAEALAGAAV